MGTAHTEIGILRCYIGGIFTCEDQPPLLQFGRESSEVRHSSYETPRPASWH